MSRPRAGHGSTAISVAGKCIALIGSDSGGWFTTGEALGWPRCVRCRRPFEPWPNDEHPGSCTICFYYHLIPKETFWSRDGDYHFPYNCGRRSMLRCFDVLEQIRRAGPFPPWRRMLREHRTALAAPAKATPAGPVEMGT